MTQMLRTYRVTITPQDVAIAPQDMALVAYTEQQAAAKTRLILRYEIEAAGECTISVKRES